MSTSRALRPTQPPVGDLGHAISRARIDAGLSQRELAMRSGVSNSTIAQLEQGADAQWSTLAALLEALPSLGGWRVLPNPAGHPPPALGAAWRAHRDLFGWECERITVTLRLPASGRTRAFVEAGPIRMSDGRTPDADALTALMRTVALTTTRARESFDAGPLLQRGRCEVAEDDARHRFELRRRRPASLMYDRESSSAGTVQLESGAEPREAATFLLTHPVRRLRLVVEVPHRAVVLPRALAWLPAAMSEPWDSELLRYLHPGVRVRRRQLHHAQSVELTVEWPPVGTRYALAVMPPGRARRRARSRPEPVRTFQDVADRLAEVRRRHGLSLRQLASDLRLSPSLIHAIESGAGGRASTLGAYLDRFRELAPQDLLPALKDGGSLGRDLLWDYYARLFGVVADELVKKVQIRNDGMFQTQLITRHLRAMGRHDEPVRLRAQLQTVIAAQEPLPPELVGASQRLRRRLVHHEGEAAWHLMFPRELAEQGTSFKRVFRWRGHYHFTNGSAAAQFGGAPPYFEGVGHVAAHPARRLTVEVRFPGEFWPPRIGFGAWPTTCPPEPRQARALDALECFRHEVHFLDHGVVRLSVEDPLPGFRFACWWALPD